MTWIAQDDFLGGKFGLAINVQWIRRVGLGVIAFAPVENQIGGKENERNFRRQFREQFGNFDIHAPRQFRIFLCLGDDGNGRAMDDQLRLAFLKFAADGGEIKQVKLVARQRPQAPAGSKSWRGLDEIISDKPVRASDPDEFHPYFARSLAKTFSAGISFTFPESISSKRRAISLSQAFLFWASCNFSTKRKTFFRSAGNSFLIAEMISVALMPEC